MTTQQIQSRSVGRHDNGAVIPCCGKVYYVSTGSKAYHYCQKCGANSDKGQSVEILGVGSAKCSEIAK